MPRTGTPSHKSLSPSGPPSTTRWDVTASRTNQIASAAGRAARPAAATSAMAMMTRAIAIRPSSAGAQIVAGVLPANASELEHQAITAADASAHPIASAAPPGNRRRVTGAPAATARARARVPVRP